MVHDQAPLASQFGSDLVAIEHSAEVDICQAASGISELRIDVEDVLAVLAFPRNADIGNGDIDAREGVKHGAQVNLGLQMMNSSRRSDNN